jgi:hypothetical protein
MLSAIAILAAILLIVGLLLYAAGWVGLWIEAFRRSFLLGVFAFGIPPVTVAFALLHWREAKTPALSLLCGLGLLALGYLIIRGLGVPIPAH